MPDARPRRSRRAPVVIAVIVLTLLGSGALALDWWVGASEEPAPAPVPDPVPFNPPVPAAASPDPGPPVEPTEPPPVLTEPGKVPTSGPGRFRYAPGTSKTLGESGPVLRFRVAVERGLNEDLAETAGFVESTLGNKRSWTGGGDRRLRRVPGDADHDFTIYFATRDTAARMCAEAGLDILGPGLPDGGVSCRTPGRAIINFTRWQKSVPHYVKAEVPLEVYRRMVLNHEVGHELGYGHAGCPGKGEPAPVMQQQTIFLDGCEANPWPYRRGGYYTGPPVA